MKPEHIELELFSEEDYVRDPDLTDYESDKNIAHHSPESQTHIKKAEIYKEREEQVKIFYSFLNAHTDLNTNSMFFVKKVGDEFLIKPKRYNESKAFGDTLTSGEIEHLAPNPAIEELGPEEWTDVVVVSRGVIKVKRNMKISNYGRFKTLSCPEPHYRKTKIGETPKVSVNKTTYTVIKLVALAFGEVRDKTRSFRTVYKDPNSKLNTHISNISYTADTSRPNVADITQVKSAEEIDLLLAGEEWMSGPFVIQPEYTEHSRSEQLARTYHFPANMSISTAGRIKYGPKSAPQWVTRVDRHQCPILSLAGKTIRVAKIVAHAFIPKPNKYCERVGQVNIKDPLNCSIHNVYWQVPKGSNAIEQAIEEYEFPIAKDLEMDINKLNAELERGELSDTMRCELLTKRQKIINEINERKRYDENTRKIHEAERELHTPLENRIGVDVRSEPTKEKVEFIPDVPLPPEQENTEQPPAPKKKLNLSQFFIPDPAPNKDDQLFD